MHDHGSGPGGGLDVILAVPFALAALFYLGGVVIQASRGRAWPAWRTACWLGGVAAAALAFVGPIANAAHDEFVAHMWAHLLAGMLAPVLLVVAAPVTLALRSLDVQPARRLSRVLSSAPARIGTLPVVAAALNVGGLWVLYRTPLYAAMQESVLVHLAVMAHIVVAGVLFTVAIIPVDPAPHRAGYRMRMAVLVLALAAHGILAKSLYADPPAGVGADDGRAAAMFMYYAGDAVDAVIIVILCAQWYRAAGRRQRRPALVTARPALPVRRREA